MATPKILIDGYLLGKKSGFGRFVFELCHAIGTSGTDLSFDVAVPQNVDISALKAYPNINYIKLPRVIFPIWEQLVIPFLASMKPYALVHFPYSTSAVLVPSKRRVVTVHDLTFLNREADRDFKASLIHAYYESAFKFATKSARLLISVSDTTKDALADINLSSHRIYNTVDAFLAVKRLSHATTPTPQYFLHRGSPAANHRNTDRVIEAFLTTPALSENFQLKIFGVGKGHERWGITKDQPIEFLERVSDEDLADLYSNAIAVIAPSILEGFCLPIIEGFGFNTPVITSGINPMREIAGDAALLVDPLSVSEIAEAMVKIAFDTGTSEDCILKGRLRMNAFKREAMANDLLSSYRGLMQPA